MELKFYNDYTNLLKNPLPTTKFAVQVVGDSMVDFGINDGDLVIADRNITNINDKIVIASINRELTIKKLELINGSYYLTPGNSKYKPRKIKTKDSLIIIGISCFAIKIV